MFVFYKKRPKLVGGYSNLFDSSGILMTTHETHFLARIYGSRDETSRCCE